MSNNVTEWLKNTDILNVAGFIDPVSCSDCPASIYCENVSDGAIDCADIFKDWALGKGGEE